MTQQEYKEISIDTLGLISSQSYEINGNTFQTRYHIKKMIDETRVYEPIFGLLSKPILNNPKNVHYQIINSTATTAALNLQGNLGQIGILNFASAVKAGGGWLKGRVAQEEDIMRKTTAFPSLVIQDEFYKNHSLGNPFYSNRIIFSPNVFIIKDDNFNLISPVKINLITAAAVNLNDIKKNSLLSTQISNYNKNNNINLVQTIMYNRIKQILLIAIDNKIENLVLGAFGCGVFGHDAKDIAKIFEKILIKEEYDKYFNNITFAVLDNSNYQYNFNAFYNIFSNKQ